MLSLIGCQGKGQLTGIISSSLEPTAGHSAVNGNTCSCQRCHIRQVEFRIIGFQNDIPVTATEVVAFDTGNAERCNVVCIAGSMGIEHIIGCQHIVAQLHTGRQDNLMFLFTGCQREFQSTGGLLEPTGSGCAVNGHTGSGQRGYCSQIEFCIVCIQLDIPVIAAEIVGVDTGNIKGCGTHRAVSISAEHIVLSQNTITQHSTLGNDYLMVSLVSCQGECNLTGIAVGNLEPAASHSTVNGNTGSTQRCHCRQRKRTLVGIENDIPVVAAEVVGIDAGDTNAGLYTAVSLGKEHIVFFQGETVQHHTGGKDYLVVSLISCQSKCQSAGTSLEPAGSGCAVNGRAGSG